MDILLVIVNNIQQEIGRFTVMTHIETRDRLLRLVGKTVRLVAIFVVFTLLNSTNIQLWCCCGVY